MKPATMSLIALFLCAICSCDDQGADSRNASGAPAWIGDYPVVATGATTADLNVETDRPSTVYYVVSVKPLGYSAKQIIEYGVKPSNANIKVYGAFETSGSDETRKTISTLAQRTRYYAYFVAQNKGDTVYQPSVKSKEFVTASRQDTSEFVSGAENRKVKYLIYRPEEVLKYPDKTYPIIYFLGGNGEVATQEKPINMIRNGSLPEYIHKGNDVPMMVMSIQHDRQDWNVNLIDEAIAHGNKIYPVNENKVYLTGMSGGGYGCWSYAVSHPEKLAAIIPISGGGNTSKACNLKGMAVWAFHNQTDNLVASKNTVNMINALEACPPRQEVKLLLFPDPGHDCWRRVYDKNHSNWSKSPGVAKFDIYQWLLTKSK